MTQASLLNPDRKLLREFGFTMAIAISAIFGLLLPWLFERPWPVWPWPVVAVFLTTSLFLPDVLRLPFVWWMRLGHLLSKVTTPLILGILFYIVVTPVGAARRLLRKDSMSRKLDPSTKSYRVDSRQPDDEHMERPF